MPAIDIAKVQSQVAEHADDIVTFLREICAIPSMDSQIGPVGERVQTEMTKLGFDEVWFDSMGKYCRAHRQRATRAGLRQPYRHSRHR